MHFNGCAHELDSVLQSLRKFKAKHNRNNMSSDLVKAKFVIPIVLSGNQSILLLSFNTFPFLFPPQPGRASRGYGSSFPYRNSKVNRGFLIMFLRGNIYICASNRRKRQHIVFGVDPVGVCIASFP